MSEPLKVALVALNQPGYQSLGLGYVRSYAEAHDRLRGKVALQTHDLSVDADPWWLAYRILRARPDVVAFSVACWSAASVYETCALLRASRPEVTIVLGGPEVGPIAEDVLHRNPSVDMVVRGEGEETFAELLRVLVSGKRPWMCPGVTARDGDTIVSAPDRPLIENLDEIPSPYLSGTLAPSPTNAFIETFRGCPHRCAYCYEAKGSTRIRSFSRDRVQAEVDHVAEATGHHTFSFVDSVFNLTPDRLSWLADVLEPHARRGLRLHTIEVDIERIDAAQAAELKRAGVASVETGPQSIGERALETCNRAFDPKRFSQGVAELKKQGVSVECDLIIGLPGDDPYDVIAGLRWLLNMDPGSIQASTLRVLPGTHFAATSQEVGLAYKSEPDHSVIQTETMGFADIRRMEVMAAALQSRYRARLH
ncbi:MAG: radical SAM protein [Coriobacteriales bacterium]|nr:radical SAM protein [Coriobacteriales bacterium]